MVIVIVSTLLVLLSCIGPFGQSSETKPEPDTKAPGNVTNLIGTSGDGYVSLSWNQPSDSDFARVEISFSPQVSGLGQPLIVTAGTSVLQVTGLSNEQQYSFTVISVDTTGNKSNGITVSATPLSDSKPSEV